MAEGTPSGGTEEKLAAGDSVATSTVATVLDKTKRTIPQRGSAQASGRPPFLRPDGQEVAAAIGAGRAPGTSGQAPTAAYDRAQRRLAALARGARTLNGLTDPLAAIRGAGGAAGAAAAMRTTAGMSAPPVRGRAGTSTSRVALAFSGGAAHGDFQVGACRFLYESWFGVRTVSDGNNEWPIAWPSRPDIIVGTSVGAINAALLTEGLPGSLQQLQHIWESMPSDSAMYVKAIDFQAFIQRAEGVGLFGAAALLSFPPLIAAVGAGLAGNDLLHDLYSAITNLRSLYTLAPIEAKARDLQRFWSAEGPGPRGSGVAALETSGGQLLIVVRAADDSLVWLQQNAAGNWSDPAPLLVDGHPAITSGWPTALADPSGTPGIMSSDAAGVWAFSAHMAAGPASSWTGHRLPRPSGWTPAGDYFQPTSSAVVAASGTPHVLAATTTTIPFALVFNWAEHPKDTGWPEWQELPHPQPQPHVNLVGRPAVSSWRSADPALPGEGAVIAARGMNGIIYWTAAQIAPGDNAIPTFQPWETFDATAAAELGAFVATRALLPTDTDLRALLANSGLLATSDPRLALDQHGRVVLAYRGPGYELRIARQAMPSGGSGHTPLAFESMPESFGGILTGTPIPVLVGTELRVYARGTDGGIWVIRPDSAHAGTTPPWESLGFPTGPDALVTSSSPVLGEPEVFVAADGTVHLFAVGRDRQLFHAVHGSRTPLTWTRLGTDVFTGIQVRWATVAEEDNEGRTVDEAGHFILEDPSFSMANGTVTWSPAPYGTDHPLVDPVDAVMASAAIPGIFPPRVLDSKTWVDGGVRRSIPIRAAIDAGATEIVAVAASAAVPARERRVLAATLDEEMAQLAHGYELPPDVGPSDGVSMPAFLPGAAPLDSYANANAIDLGYRAAMDLLPASVLEAEMLPESTYPVPVYPVQPTFDVNDPFTIDPGLVRIAEDYGYMRAADVLVTPGGSIEAAIASSDRITAARRRCWILEQAFIDTCAIVTYRPLYDGLKDWLATFGGQQAAGFFGGPAGLVLSMGSSFDPQVVINAGRVPVDRLVELRANLAAHKDALALLVQDRQAAGFPMPVTSAAWSQLWERHGSWAGSGERVASLAAQPPEAHLRGSWRLQCPWDSSFSLHFPAI